LNPVFERFVEESPISVMARDTMERVLYPEQSTTTARGQSFRNLVGIHILLYLKDILLISFT